MLRKILRRITVPVVSAIGLTGLIYLAGIITQFMNNYQLWMSDDGFSGKAVMKPPDWDRK
ncbi:MAG: hypothetical protein IJ661_11095 [Lachnospiraceae bacterium]|nr:hypothetical protein [Lachnospiraceae bacterium]